MMDIAQLAFLAKGGDERAKAALTLAIATSIMPAIKVDPMNCGKTANTALYLAEALIDQSGVLE